MNFGKWMSLVVLCVALYVLWEIRQVLLLGFTAVVLASALNGFVRLISQKIKIRRGLAIGLAVLLLFGFAAVFILLVIPPFIEQFQQLASLVPQGAMRLKVLSRWIEGQIPGPDLISPELLNNISQEFSPLAGRIFENFFAIFSNSLLVVLNILLVLVLTIMFLIEPDKYRSIFIRLFPSFYRRRVEGILDQCEVGLDSWIAGILFNMAIIGICSFFGLLALQVRLPLANGLIAGLLEAIPNIGPTLSVIPPVAIALLDAPWKAGAVLAFYVVLQQLEQYLLVPTVMAKQVALLPAVTLLSQIAFAFFFGFLGLLLALPLVIVGQIWIKEILVKDILDNWDRPVVKRVKG